MLYIGNCAIFFLFNNQLINIKNTAKEIVFPFEDKRNNAWRIGEKESNRASS